MLALAAAALSGVSAQLFALAAKTSAGIAALLATISSLKSESAQQASAFKSDNDNEKAALKENNQYESVSNAWRRRSAYRNGLGMALMKIISISYRRKAWQRSGGNGGQLWRRKYLLAAKAYQAQSM
jgi:hypothetical protein